MNSSQHQISLSLYRTSLSQNWFSLLPHPIGSTQHPFAVSKWLCHTTVVAFHIYGLEFSNFDVPNWLTPKTRPRFNSECLSRNNLLFCLKFGICHASLKGSYGVLNLDNFLFAFLWILKITFCSAVRGR